LTFWLPTTIKNLSGGSDTHAALQRHLYACRSRRVYPASWADHRDRKWTCIAGMWATASCWRKRYSRHPFGCDGVLLLTGPGCHLLAPPFWALPRHA